MPQYMLLIYGPGEDTRTPEEVAAEHPRWMAYTEEMEKAGVLRAGDALHPVETATTVRGRAGEVEITDGPFAETKEILAGYYTIEVPDLDSALKWASRAPIVGRGAVEVRPVVDFAAMQQAEPAGSATA
jgi:hypothetical protein